MGQFGEIDSSTIMRDPSGRSRGFAFLTYSNVSSVDKVMGQVHHLDGKQASHPLSLSYVTQLIIRSTRNEPSLEPNTRKLPKSLLVV
jgi:RNA recognition motif-containing protein